MLSQPFDRQDIPARREWAADQHEILRREGLRDAAALMNNPERVEVGLAPRAERYEFTRNEGCFRVVHSHDLTPSVRATLLKKGAYADELGEEDSYGMLRQAVRAARTHIKSQAQALLSELPSACKEEDGGAAKLAEAAARLTITGEGIGESPAGWCKSDRGFALEVNGLCILSLPRKLIVTSHDVRPGKKQRIVRIESAGGAVAADVYKTIAQRIEKRA